MYSFWVEMEWRRNGMEKTLTWPFLGGDWWNY